MNNQIVNRPPFGEKEVKELIHSGTTSFIIKHLAELFGEQHHRELVDAFIKSSESAELIISQLPLLKGINHQDLAERLIMTGKKHVFVRHMDKFPNLDLKKLMRSMVNY